MTEPGDMDAAIRRAAGRMPSGSLDVGPQEGEPGFEEAVNGHVMDSYIRGAALANRPGPREPDTPPPPPDFDGGARGSLPSAPPSMDDLIRAQRLGELPEEFKR